MIGCRLVMIFNIIELGMLLAPVLNPYHEAMSSTVITVTNIMACRVFRKTKHAIEVADNADAAGNKFTLLPSSHMDQSYLKPEGQAGEVERPT
jgi:hypothetical protein